MCLICMKYRIIILIIIISLGKISSYIANTSRTHARTLANTHTPTHDRRCIGAPNQSVIFGRTVFDAGETMANLRIKQILD